MALTPPPRETLPPDPDDGAPQSIGMAEMLKDGTLHLHLRTQLEDGTIGEMLMVVPPKDPRYPAMQAHLPDLKPGRSQPLPPFPPTAVDPDSV